MKNKHEFVLLKDGVIVIQPSMGPLPKLDLLALVSPSMPNILGNSKKSMHLRHDKSEVLPRDKAQVQTFETYVLLKMVVSLK